MRRFRFTIGSLLGLVLFVAVAFAGLRESTDAWESGVFGAALLMLLVAVLLAVHRGGRKRAYWLGFALFGWVYLVASLVPPIEARLPTTRGLSALSSQRRTATPVGVAVADFDSDGWVDVFVANNSTNSVFRNQGNGVFQDVTAAAATARPVLTRSQSAWQLLAAAGGTAENFVRLGHSLLALALAFAGGCLSRHLAPGEQVQAAIDPGRGRPA